MPEAAPQNAPVATTVGAQTGTWVDPYRSYNFKLEIQGITETSGTIISPLEMWEVFTDTYIPGDSDARLISSEVTTGGSRTTVVAQLLVDGKHMTVKGEGNGPIDAFVSGLRSELGVDLEVRDYREHALTSGSGASAVAYVEAEAPDGRTWWGVGMASSILDASLHAVVSAANRVFSTEEVTDPRL